MRASGSLLVVSGLTLLLFVAYEVVGTSIVAGRNQAALAAEFARQDVSKPAVRPRIGSPVFRIRIPRIGLDKVVVEGTSRTELAKGPGHYRATPLPGRLGPVGIAGHRNGWGSPFLNLDKLRRGDDIYLETRLETFQYRVTGSTIVGPSKDWVLKGDPHVDAPYELTLTTCTPKFTSRLRLIVWASMVSPHATS